MTARADYSVEEWDLLRDTVIGASVAVMLSDLQSGITGLFREQTAFAKILAAGVQLERATRSSPRWLSPTNGRRATSRMR